MGRPKTEKTRKVVLTIPEEIAMYMEYFVKVVGQARTNSDLVIQLVNELVDQKRNTLNDKGSWKKLINKIDDMKADVLEEILGGSSSEEKEIEE